MNKSFTKNQKELMKRKRMLFKKAKGHQAKVEKTPNLAPNTSKVDNSAIKKLKQSLADKQREYAKLKNENISLKKQHREDKQRIYQIKKQQQSFDRKIKKQREVEQTVLREKQNYFEQQLADFNKNNIWLKEHGLDQNGDTRRTINILSRRNEILTQLAQILITQTNQLDLRIKTIKHSVKQVQKSNTRLSAANKVLTKQANKWEKQSSLDRQRRREAIEQAQHTHRLENISIESMINELIHRITTANIDSYRQLNALVQKYDRIFDNLLTVNSQVEKYCYGYLEEVKDENQFILHDINHNQTMPVVIPDHLQNDISANMVVRCKHNSFDQWEIDQIYKTISTSTIRSSKQHHHQKGIKRTDDNLPEVYLTNRNELLWLRTKKLVLIGNKYSSGFLNELKRYCQVKTYDAYEGREHQIFQAMQAADIVFLLIGSVPHFVTEYTRATNDLGKNSAKVQTFEVPAKYDGVIRLHYLYVNRDQLKKIDN